MKKLLFLATAAVALVACNGQTVKIKGYAPAAADSTMIVLYSDLTGSAVDTAYVVGEEFSFTTTVDVPHIMNVNGAPIVAEPGTIKLTLGADSKVSGTPLNDALNAMIKARQTIGEEARGMMNEISEIAKDETEKLKDAREKFNAYIESVYEPAMYKVSSEVFEAHKANPLGAIVFTTVIKNDTIPDIQQIEEYYELYPQARNFKSITDEYERLKQEAKTAVGQMFTDFTVRNIEDTEDVKLSKYVGQGNYVLVDFWASWCGPCIRAIPDLKTIQQKYRRSKLTILGVNVWDTHSKAVASIKEKKLTWPQLYDNSGRGQGCTQLYSVRGIPTLILFSPEGEILFRTHNSAEMLEFVQGVMSK